MNLDDATVQRFHVYFAAHGHVAGEAGLDHLYHGLNAMSYEAGGKQYIAVAAGSGLFAFTLK